MSEDLTFSPRINSGENVGTEPEQRSVPTAEISTPATEEGKKRKTAWASLNDFMYSLGIDLNINQEHIKKFEEEKSTEEQESVYQNIEQALKDIPMTVDLKKKFSAIELSYPQYEPEEQIFIRNGVLFIDLGIDKQKMFDFFGSLFASENGDGQNSPDSAPKSDINEAAGINGENIKIGDTVEWNFGDSVNRGKVVEFFTATDGRVGAVVNAGGVEKPVEAYAQDLSLVKEETPTPTPEPVVEVLEEVPEWKKGEEWETLCNLRTELATIEAKNNRFSENSGRNVEDIRKEYEAKKKEIAKKIKEFIVREAGWEEGDKIPADENAKLNSKINDLLFLELIEKENQAYLEALRSNREVTWKDKLKIETAKIFSTKTMQWYLGLSRNQRMFLNFGVGGIAGLTFGATVAPGVVGVASYLAWRAARVGTSGFASMKAGEWANKKWSIEDLENAKNKEIEDLKNSDLPIEQKSKGFEEIQQRYKREKIKMTLKKVGTTIAAGGLTGLATGILEHAVMSPSEVANSSPELTKAGTGDGAQDHKTPLGRFEPNPKYVPSEIKTPDVLVHSDLTPKPEYVPSEIETPATLTHSDLEPQTPPAPEKFMPEPSISEEAVLKELFKDPSVVKHKVASGDSVWKMLKETLEHNDKFKNLSGTGIAKEIADQTEAKQTRVLQALVGEVLKNHDQYNVGPNGEIEIGESVDFTKLFSDRKHYEDIIEEAENLKPAQVSSINLNNEKIEAWIKANPGKPVDVDEILNYRPEHGALAFDQKLAEFGPSEIKTPDVLVHSDLTPKPEYVPSEIKTPEALIHSDMEADVSKKAGELKNFEEQIPNDMEEMEKSEIEELEAAKKRLAELEGQQKLTEQQLSGIKQSPVSSVLTEANGNHRTSEMPGLRSLAGDVERIIANAADIDNNLKADIHHIYGKDGFWGFGMVEGIKTPDWAFMRGLPANKVLEYFRNPENSDLPPNILNQLATSVKHRAMVEYLMRLVDDANTETGVEIKPFENENVEAFIKRAGRFIMEHAPAYTKK